MYIYIYTHAYTSDTCTIRDAYAHIHAHLIYTYISIYRSIHRKYVLIYTCICMQLCLLYFLFMHMFLYQDNIRQQGTSCQSFCATGRTFGRRSGNQRHHIGRPPCQSSTTKAWRFPEVTGVMLWYLWETKQITSPLDNSCVWRWPSSSLV